MKKTSRLIHKELKERISILDNSKLLSNFLNECILTYDSTNPNHKGIAKQLISAHDCGVVQKILDLKERDKFLRDRLIEEIIKNTGYGRNTAEWIIDTWLDLIDQEVIDLWLEYKIQMEKEISDNQQMINIKQENIIERDLVMKTLIGGLLIPCGIGYDDKGFYVSGIKETYKCNDTQESIYAVIFNYLQRNTRIDEKVDKPYFIVENEERLDYDIDYRSIYRLMMIILLMIKNNYLHDDVLSFDYTGRFQELQISFLTINNYIKQIAKLIGMKTPKKIRYQRNPKLQISVDGNNKSDIYIIPNKDAELKDRIIWFGPKINYKIEDNNIKELEYFLREISDYKYFQDGQFEAIKQMLNGKSHKVCIMPTGSGKSLIFYLISLLQPGVTFVIAPTELLISDQIENLQKYHRINDSKALKFGDNFINLNLTNKIYYLTPETFQNRDLLREFINLNSIKGISNIVLDEVHCISNWSHDFRPEYLMLSTYLNRYLDRIYFLGFTATANYSVIKDIKTQLIIEDRDIISPIKLERDNIKFSFIGCEDFEQMAEQSYQFLKRALTDGQKTLVFTKNEEVSDQLLELLDDIQYEVEIFREIDKTAYRAFADGKCKILIASEEFGVGINLSDVHNILHFGLPISKGEYVQEIGRAGRNGEPSSSLVVYMRCNNINVDERLLQRTTEISRVVKIISEIEDIKADNDYINVYRRIVGNLDEEEEFKRLLHIVYNRVKNIKEGEEIDFKYDDMEKVKKALYILFVIGFINNWSLVSIDYEKDKVVFLIALREESFELDKIKEKTKENLYLLGNDRKSIIEIGRATTTEGIIDIYNNWYYNHFIYHHKEQFLDMLSFIESYKVDNKRVNSHLEINKRLAEYFSLSMLDISQDEAKYINLSFKEIVNTIVSGVEHSTLSNIQKINQDYNNIKLDYFLFIYSLLVDNEYEEYRINRILSKMVDEIYFDFIESLSILYGKITVGNKFKLFKDINIYVGNTNEKFITFFDMIFRTNEKDLIYYGVLAKKMNLKFRGVYNV